jgi:hypothetical protein
MANEYAINYEDDRFKQVESEKQNALTENDSLYGNLVNESEKYYQAQIDASKNWADTQSQLQQEKTDFAIEQIEQQKEQAQKDYTKEQSGAYVDWQKQSNQYGVRAEQLADKGLQNTGYSESAQVSMYNTYQNRVATARESYNNAVLNYNNSIKDAQLQNNSALAEIAYQALQQQLELSLQGFQYKNNLLLEQANKKLEIENQYYNRYQDVLDQINKENSLAEQVRQYNESLALEREQFEWQKAQASRSYGGGGGYYSGGGSGGSAKLTQDDSSDAFKTGQPLLKGAANAKTYLKNTLNSIVNSSDFKASKISNINAAVSVAINNGTVSSSEGAALIQSYSRQVK